MSTVSNPPGSAPRKTSLLGEQERARLKRRQRVGQAFAAITFVPVILAIALILTLFADVIFDTLSWQVVEPNNSGQTFAWSEAPLGGLAVMRLELSAQGLSDSDIEAIISDPAELTRFRARNRVELMWHTEDGSMRWVVTNSRDDRLDYYGFFEGFGQFDRLAADLGPDQNIYLNPWLDFSFLTRNNSRTPVVAGLKTAIAGSLWVVGLIILFALPLGVGAALYLEEYAPQNTFTRFIEVNIRNLAGVPSIVYGILGLYLFVRLLNFGPTILAAAVTLSLLILPVVIIAAREAIRAVPGSLREASYGLGATKWQTVSQVVLPNAVAGITTGIILSVARAIGETAPLLLIGAAAFIPFMPEGPLSRYTVMPIQIYSWVAENDVEYYNVASAGIIVLLTILLLLYGLAFFVRRRFERSW